VRCLMRVSDAWDVEGVKFGRLVLPGVAIRQAHTGHAAPPREQLDLNSICVDYVELMLS
jgi:hypothetical protein